MSPSVALPRDLNRSRPYLCSCHIEHFRLCRTEKGRLYLEHIHGNKNNNTHHNVCCTQRRHIATTVACPEWLPGSTRRRLPHMNKNAKGGGVRTPYGQVVLGTKISCFPRALPTCRRLQAPKSTPSRSLEMCSDPLPQLPTPPILRRCDCILRKPQCPVPERSIEAPFIALARLDDREAPFSPSLPTCEISSPILATFGLSGNNALLRTRA
jgi:hypothetical protein